MTDLRGMNKYSNPNWNWGENIKPSHSSGRNNLSHCVRGHHRQLNDNLVGQLTRHCGSGEYGVVDVVGNRQGDDGYHGRTKIEYTVTKVDVVIGGHQGG